MLKMSCQIKSNNNRSINYINSINSLILYAYVCVCHSLFIGVCVCMKKNECMCVFNCKLHVFVCTKTIRLEYTTVRSGYGRRYSMFQPVVLEQLNGNKYPKIWFLSIYHAYKIRPNVFFT